MDWIYLILVYRLAIQRYSQHLIEAGGSGGDIYRHPDHGAASGSIVEGDLELDAGSGQSINRIRWINNQFIFSDTPFTENIQDFFESGDGFGATISIQDADGVQSFIGSDNITGTQSGNVSRFLPPTAFITILENIIAGSRFILAITRVDTTVQTLELESSIAPSTPTFSADLDVTTPPTGDGVSLFDASITADTDGVVFGPYSRTAASGGYLVSATHTGLSTDETIPIEYIVSGETAYVGRLRLTLLSGFATVQFYLSLSTNSGGGSVGPSLVSSALAQDTGLGISVRTSAGTVVFFGLDELNDATEPYQIVDTSSSPLFDSDFTDELVAGDARFLIVDRSNSNIDWDNQLAFATGGEVASQTIELESSIAPSTPTFAADLDVSVVAETVSLESDITSGTPTFAADLGVTAATVELALDDFVLPVGEESLVLALFEAGGDTTLYDARICKL